MEKIVCLYHCKSRIRHDQIMMNLECACFRRGSKIKLYNTNYNYNTYNITNQNVYTTHEKKTHFNEDVGDDKMK